MAELHWWVWLTVTVARWSFDWQTVWACLGGRWNFLLLFIQNLLQFGISSTLLMERERKDQWEEFCGAECYLCVVSLTSSCDLWTVIWLKTRDPSSPHTVFRWSLFREKSWAPVRMPRRSTVLTHTRHTLMSQHVCHFLHFMGSFFLFEYYILFAITHIFIWTNL